MKLSLQRAGVALLAALTCPHAIQAQVCNGLPFRGAGAVSASYTSGDAADTPYAIRQYGAALVRQLPGWSPLGAHQALRLDGFAGSASWQGLPAGAAAPVDLVGRQVGAGAAYTMDALPQSYAGAYVLCLSAGLQASGWSVDGRRGGGITAPAWLSFGVPLRAGPFGAFPHAGFGGYLRALTGDGPTGTLRATGVRPFGDSGLGLIVGPLHLDASVRHEFKARSRVVISLGH